MRELDIGTRKYSKVVCLDEPGAGGACHVYEVLNVKDDPETALGVFGQIHFQEGPVKETGVNGCHQEDLLVIVMDRLQHFQRGEFACRENTLALTKIEEALHWLRARTTERETRGVEGQNII